MDRRQFLKGVFTGAGVLALGGCKGDNPKPREPQVSEGLSLLFEGFSEYSADGALVPMRSFYDDEYPTVYFGASREVYDGCSGDVEMWADGMNHKASESAFVPVLVMPLPHEDDPDSVFLDAFKDLQAAFPEARILSHTDPKFVASFGIRNRGRYHIFEDGWVAGHSQSLHVFNPDAEQLVFQGQAAKDGLLNAEGFRHLVGLGVFEGAINPNAVHIDSRLRALDQAHSGEVYDLDAFRVG